MNPSALQIGLDTALHEAGRDAILPRSLGALAQFLIVFEWIHRLLRVLSIAWRIRVDDLPKHLRIPKVLRHQVEGFYEGQYYHWILWLATIP